jgi:hypothetical protein
MPTLPLDPVAFELTETMKERPLDANPQRHFADKQQAMFQDLLGQLIARGCIAQELKPTGKPFEYTFTIRMKALKA